MIKSVNWSSCKVSIILVLFQLNFSTYSKNIQISNFMKIRQWEPSCFVRTDRHDDANSDFSQFCERA